MDRAPAGTTGRPGRSDGPTGDPAVDAILAPLTDAAHAPWEERLALLEAVHQGLQDHLTDGAGPDHLPEGGGRDHLEGAGPDGIEGVGRDRRAGLGSGQ